ncbi:MAG TPA: endolytic transglycosylase MltG, partial [Polyangiales bacterium]
TSPDFRPRRLQADPTVAYGCLVARDRVPSCRDFDGRRVTPAMVRDPANPYSTYRIEGLPPGPICNPGLSALDAALAPAQHEYFYFVTHGGGRHQFTRTLEEHNQRVHNPP